MQLLVLAAALPPAAPYTLPSAALDIPAKLDLHLSRACNPAGPEGEIVVCARPDANQRYRYRDLSVDGATILPRAEFRLNDAASLAVTTQSANVGGFTSNRVMVTLKLGI